MRYRNAQIVKLVLAGLLFFRPHALSAAPIPVFPGASQVVYAQYTANNWPSWFPANGADSAAIVKYQVPKAADSKAVMGYYTRTLSKDHWTGPVIVQQDNHYFLYQRNRDRIVIRVQDQDGGDAVEALALTFPPGATPSNQGTLTLQQSVENVPLGAAIHVVCPAGFVKVHSRPGSAVQFAVTAHASTDYPLTASDILKKVQLTSQADGDGVDLGVTAAGVPDDGTARLAYEFDVTVPTGANLNVLVQGAAAPDCQTANGNVDVGPGAADVVVTTTGAVSINGATGRVSVNTDGPVILRSLSSDILVHTREMWIRGFDVTVKGIVDLETSDARIDLGLSAVDDGSLKCVTSNAPITLHVPADASADITVTGADAVNGPIPAEALPTTAGPRRWHSLLNGGRIPIDIETSAGLAGGASVYIQNK